jgi:hypothetical protein
MTTYLVLTTRQSGVVNRLSIASLVNDWLFWQVMP